MNHPASTPASTRATGSAARIRAGTELRLLRAAVFTAACVLLSAAGHTFAAGAPVPLWSLGTGCAVVFAATAPLAGRERSLRGIVFGLAAGQLALHTLFSGPTGAAGHTGSAGSAGSAGNTDIAALAAGLLCNGRTVVQEPAEAHRIVTEAAVPVAAGDAGGPAGGWPDPVRHLSQAALSLADGPMVLGHLLAAVLTGWLLRRGDLALWQLIRLSAGAAERAECLAAETLLLRALRTALAWVRLRSGALVPDPPARPLRAGSGQAAPRSVVLRHTVVRRGPPAPQRAFSLAA